METFITILKWGLVVFTIVGIYAKHKVAYREISGPKGAPLIWFLTFLFATFLTVVEIIIWGSLTYGIYYLFQIIT